MKKCNIKKLRKEILSFLQELDDESHSHVCDGDSWIDAEHSDHIDKEILDGMITISGIVYYDWICEFERSTQRGYGQLTEVAEYDIDKLSAIYGEEQSWDIIDNIIPDIINEYNNY